MPFSMELVSLSTQDNFLPISSSSSSVVMMTELLLLDIIEAVLSLFRGGLSPLMGCGMILVFLRSSLVLKLSFIA